MNTVLAAIDFSRVSRKVLSTAIEIARAIGGRVVVLNAVQPPPIATDLAPFVADAIRITDDIERSSRRYLHRLQQQLAARGTLVETMCQQGFAVSLILAQAEALNAQYVVLGSHGHSALYDMVAGSTASGVVKRSPCPVVVVPAAPPKSQRPRNGRRKFRARPSSR